MTIDVMLMFISVSYRCYCFFYFLKYQETITESCVIRYNSTFSNTLHDNFQVLNVAEVSTACCHISLN